MVSVITHSSTPKIRTLGEITEKLYDYRMRKFVEICVLGCQITSCISYLRYFGE